MKKLMRFLKDEEGLVAIEYGLIATLVAIAIIVAVTALGNQLIVVFNAITAALT